jgi:hypothetical protein
MYIAPLNYDRFFKKIFSDVNIAKSFLEDFFEFTIESITPLNVKHKITDDATAVEFDYRCKVDGQYIIVDMQQWYKTDIVKRFYMYHCLNTALQLEGMEFKSFWDDDTQQRETLDYDQVEPIITFIWMADDRLKFTQDYIGYTLTPEMLSDFVKEKGLWRDDNMLELMKQRNEILSIMNNDEKGLQFLSKNRLIFAFQKNIVKNILSQKKGKRYEKWFEFAETTKKPKNTQSDFVKYQNDEILKEVMRRLSKEVLTDEDFKYIENYEKFHQQFLRHEASIRKNALAEGLQQGIAIGEEKAKTDMIKSLLQGTNFEVSYIAKLANVAESFVQAVKENLNK